MSGLPKKYCRWNGEVNLCLPSMSSISTSLMCVLRPVHFLFILNLKARKSRKVGYIFLFLWVALSLVPGRVPLPLWTIQWNNPSLETSDADLRSIGYSFWLKSPHLHSRFHFACLETAAIRGKCCHSNMRSNFGFLFFLELAGEQRRQKSLNATESVISISTLEIKSNMEN